MKILRLRFTNLNSLRGASPVLDFTEAPFAGCGLFAIIGPTGAGKTTILDALTLALYGKAARYGDTKPEQMMSRHTGECAAEVEFECARGIYRCVWQLRRARLKADGALQPPVRRLIAVADEAVIAQRSGDVDAKISELTGLDYGRFLRSVMLAQGGFAAFLKAETNERTALLEQVTGTAIYGEISRATFERTKQAEQAMAMLKVRQGEVVILTAEERAHRQQSIEQLREELTKLTQTILAAGQRQSAAQAAVRCLAEARSLTTEVQDLLTAQAAFAEQAAQLAQHQRALPFQGVLADWSNATAAVQQHQATHLQWQQRLPELQKAAQEAAVQEQTTQSLRQHEESAALTLRPLLLEITTLDANLLAKQHHLAEQEKLHSQKQQEFVKLSDERSAAQQALNLWQGQLQAAEAWVDAHGNEAELRPLLTELTAAIRLWAEKQNQLAEVAQALKTQQPILITLQRQGEESSAQARKLETLRQQAAERQISGQAAVELLLEGATSAEWEAKRDHALQRQGQIQELQRLHKERIDWEAQRGQLERSRAEGVGELQQLSVAAAAQVEQETQARALLNAHRQTLSFAQQVQSLESHRSALQPDEACPLCGSLTHPFADSSALPAREVVRLTAVVAEAEARVQELQATANQLRDKVVRAETALSAIAETLQQLEVKLAANAVQADFQREAWGLAGLDLTAEHDAQSQAVARLAARVRDLRQAEQHFHVIREEASAAERLWQQHEVGLATIISKLESAQTALAATNLKLATAKEAVLVEATRVATLLASVGEQATVLPEAAQAMQRLEKRARTWETKSQQVTEFKAKLSACQATLVEKTAQHTRGAPELAASEVARLQSRQEYEQMRALRLEKFGERSVPQAERELERKLAAARQAQEQATSLHQRTQAALEVGRQRIQEASVALTKAQAAQAEQERVLIEQALAVGFQSIASLQAASLDPTLAQALAEQDRALQNRLVSITTRREALAKDQASLPPGATEDAERLEALQQELTTLQAAQAQAQGQHAVLTDQLEQDAAARAKHQEMAAEIQTAELDWQRWGRLNALIGSASGLAFAKFAQGLTLERLVALANRHLAQLNPRYSLRRDDRRAEELELEIVDHYQAETTRAMQSLSGGESFLASLALALGLSELAGGRTKIDSLFIDEGFGSLDADTLEVAMSALENLRGSGKMIGVISHVEAMKERIATQIRVVKTEGGCSRLEI